MANAVFMSQKDPKVIVPMQRGETLRPLRPMYRCSTYSPFVSSATQAAWFSTQSVNCSIVIGLLK